MVRAGGIATEVRQIPLMTIAGQAILRQEAETIAHQTLECYLNYMVGEAAGTLLQAALALVFLFAIVESTEAAARLH